MSTSPSWFDKEKFSRLVKKVGARSGSTQSASSLPASGLSAPSATGSVQLPPAPTPADETSAPTSSAVETPARPTTSAIPKPSASLPFFTYKAVTPAAVAPQTTSAPVAKAPEPAPEKTPEPPPAAPAPVARVFLAPPPAEVSAPAPEPEAEEEGKPKFMFEAPKAEPEAQKERKPMFSFDIPKSELPAKPLPPEPPAEKAESAADFHVAEPANVAQRRSHATTSTLQRLPRITPDGPKAHAPPISASTLLRRTTALPGVKPLTEPLPPMERTEVPIRAAGIAASSAMPSSFQSPDVPSEETAFYKGQIAYLNQERDNLAAKVAELNLAVQERDEASFEAATLRSQLAAAREQNTAALRSKEVILVTDERDAARRDYAELRQQYERIKQDQLGLKNEHAASLADLRKQIEAARRQGGGHEQELAADKDGVIETLKQELKSLHEQVARARDEASTAQRGLALSQKALQETHAALREAAEAKGAIENLKKERSNLVQQNMMLLAQNDRIDRELGALKAKASK